VLRLLHPESKGNLLFRLPALCVQCFSLRFSPSVSKPHARLVAASDLLDSRCPVRRVRSRTETRPATARWFFSRPAPLLDFFSLCSGLVKLPARTGGPARWLSCHQVMRLCCLDFSVSSSSAFHFDAKISHVACESLQGDAGIALESLDQKTQGFVVQTALSRWFPERVHQVFSEITVRI
jgi:hypothetical protein